jgi:hypothetical protein
MTQCHTDEMTIKDEKEPFVARWSRLKEESRTQSAENAPASPARQEEDAKSEPPELPPLDKLTFDSDYRGFFHPKVPEDVRCAALKQLFSDPRFNVMDGLDVYIEDYNQPNPLPAAMLAGLEQAQRILEWAKTPQGDKNLPGAPERTEAEGPRALEDTRSAPPPSPGPHEAERSANAAGSEEEERKA